MRGSCGFLGSVSESIDEGRRAILFGWCVALSSIGTCGKSKAGQESLRSPTDVCPLPTSGRESQIARAAPLLRLYEAPVRYACIGNANLAESISNSRWVGCHCRLALTATLEQNSTYLVYQRDIRERHYEFHQRVLTSPSLLLLGSYSESWGKLGYGRFGEVVGVGLRLTPTHRGRSIRLTPRDKDSLPEIRFRLHFPTTRECFLMEATKEALLSILPWSCKANLLSTRYG